MPEIDRRHNRHQRQEAGADVGDADHHLFQVVGRPLARPIAGNERAVVLQVLGHVLRIEGDRRPEVAEEVNQRDVQHVVDERRAARERVVQTAAATCDPGYCAEPAS